MLCASFFQPTFANFYENVIRVVLSMEIMIRTIAIVLSTTRTESCRFFSLPFPFYSLYVRSRIFSFVCWASAFCFWRIRRNKTKAIQPNKIGDFFFGFVQIIAIGFHDALQLSVVLQVYVLIERIQARLQVIHNCFIVNIIALDHSHTFSLFLCSWRIINKT